MAAGGDAFREQVREATDIVEVIGERVVLRPAGAGRFAGLCPFHKETAPSFQVHAEKGFFHCFGCKESGDVFSFLMKREGLQFPEAVHLLARRAGIPIPERDPRRASRDERLREANRKALAYFRKALGSPPGAKALAYLRERRLSRQTIGEHGLGFATAGWSDLAAALQRGGVAKSTLVEAGLVREGTGGGHYDFFRDRVIVPFLDGQGRAIGFAGRSLDGSEPKYVNSPDSPIYRKRSVLYGFHHQRAAIRRERSAILFEGYFDCLSAWQAGVSGAVAVGGTALTPDHAKLLAAQAREVVLAFDGDEAGRRATGKSLPILLEAQLQVRIVPLAPGSDPDEVVRAEGGAAFRERVRTAPGFIEFLVDGALRRRSAGGGEDRARAAREVLQVIAQAPSPLDRETWLAEAAGPLGFSLTAAQQEMERLRRQLPRSASLQAPRAGEPGPGARRGDPGESSPRPPPKSPTPAERDLIRWVEPRPDEVARNFRATDAADLEGFATSPLLLELKQAAEDGAESLAARLRQLAAEPGEEQRLLVGIQMEPVGLNTRHQSPQDCFDALRLSGLRRRLAGLQAAVRSADEGAEAPLREVQRLSEEMDSLLRGSRD